MPAESISSAQGNEKLSPKKEAKYTTVPEFFFTCIDMIHYGLVPIIDHILQIKRANAELEEKKIQAQQEPFLCNRLEYIKYIVQRIEQLINSVRNLKIIYDLMLLSNKFYQKIIRFYRLVITLLLQWGGYDKNIESFASPPSYLFTKLPLYFLTDIPEVLSYILSPSLQDKLPLDFVN